MFGGLWDAIHAIWCWCFGGRPQDLAYLLLAVGIDGMYGIRVARKRGMFAIRILVRKAVEKIGTYLALVMLAHGMEAVAATPDVATRAVVVALINLEAVSVLKHIATLGNADLARTLEFVLRQFAKGGIRVEKPQSDGDSIGHDMYGPGGSDDQPCAAIVQ